LLLAIGFAAGGFVLVWQGFGLAGFGTDLHALRALAACVPLFVCGLVIAWPKVRLPVRVVVALLGLGAAGLAWWTVPNSAAPSGRSLRDAVAARDRFRELLSTATVDGTQIGEVREIHHTLKQYPGLAPDLPENYGRWSDRMWRDIRTRYERTPPDEVQAIIAIRDEIVLLAEIHPPASWKPIADTTRQWLRRAVDAKVDELTKAQHDWDAFDRTAPGRRKLMDAFPETYAELAAAEEEWVQVTVLAQAWLRIAAGERPKPPAGGWLGREKAILSLPSLDTRDVRFKTTREELFRFAHDDAKSSVTAHLDAGRYEQAFGVARKHAVEWSATAAVLGADEVKQLDALRDSCETFARLFEVSAKPTEPADIAPPPRAKPD
jgi:hypothetical protein